MGSVLIKWVVIFLRKKLNHQKTPGGVDWPGFFYDTVHAGGFP